MIRALIASVALATAPMTATAQDTTDLSPAQAREFAALLADDGQLDQAFSLINALLERDPNDAQTLFLLTQISRAMGNADAVATYGARAYRSTDDPRLKYGSARLVAQAYAVREQDTRAMVWLRRARQFAPDDASADDVADDFRFIRQRNPLGINLSFGIAPSGNVNNGSANSSSELFGLPLEFDLSAAAQALSGLSIDGGVELTYRLRETQRSQTRASAFVNYQTYVLSNTSQRALQDEFDEQAAKCDEEETAAEQDSCRADLDPVDTGADFAYGTLDFGLMHLQQIGPRNALMRVGANIGQNWYGGDPYARYLALTLDQNVPVGQNDLARFSIGYRFTNYLDDPAGTAPDTRLSVAFSWQRRLESGGQLRVGLGVNEVTGDDRDRENTAYNLSANYNFAEPVAGVDLGIGGYVEQRTYDSFSFAGGGARKDDIIGAQVTGTFSQVEYYGFRPQVAVTLRRTESTLDLYDSDSASVSFDLVSSF